MRLLIHALILDPHSQWCNPLPSASLTIGALLAQQPAIRYCAIEYTNINNTPVDKVKSARTHLTKHAQGIDLSEFQLLIDGTGSRCTTSIRFHTPGNGKLLC